jgi:hypothetical protein
MTRTPRIILLYISLLGAVLAAALIAYDLPRRMAGRRAHRVTLWTWDNYFQQKRVINAAVDPSSGHTTTIRDASERACAEPSGDNIAAKEKTK